MKKTFKYGVVVILLVWNIVLSYFVFFNNDNKVDDLAQNNNDSKVTKEVTTFETDFTKVVEEQGSKAVGIIALGKNGSEATGSGAIYKVDGDTVIIITNHHVIQDSMKVEVLFSNGKQLEAEVVGSDMYSDIAVLKVKVDFEVEAFKLGDSSSVKVGEWVVAIGSPLSMDFYGSVTVGIISGKDRVIPVDLNNDNIDDWDLVVLQTNAAVNPGNSGGPLINLNGELIGINSIKYSGTSIEGMAFSIPINEAIPIIDQLLESGEVQRPSIGIGGVALSDISNYTKAVYNIPTNITDGIYITNIVDNSSAAESGLKLGDIILEFNGKKLASFKDFRKMLYELNSGDSVTIKYLRDGKENTTKLVLK